MVSWNLNKKTSPKVKHLNIKPLHHPNKNQQKTVLQSQRKSQIPEASAGGCLFSGLMKTNWFPWIVKNKVKPLAMGHTFTLRKFNIVPEKLPGPKRDQKGKGVVFQYHHFSGASWKLWGGGGNMWTKMTFVIDWQRTIHSGILLDHWQRTIYTRWNYLKLIYWWWNKHHAPQRMMIIPVFIRF